MRIVGNSSENAGWAEQGVRGMVREPHHESSRMVSLSPGPMVELTSFGPPCGLFSMFAAVFILWAGSLAAAEPKPEDVAPSQATKTQDDYYELYKVLVDSLDQVERHYVKEVDRREMIDAAIRGVLLKLDPYSSYISRREMEKFREGIDSEFGGIGIQLAMEDEELKIISPLMGSPGAKAGLLSGDKIVEIDGKAAAGLTLDEAVERLKGPVGTKVELLVIHPGRTRKESITVTREKIHIETVLGARRGADGAGDFFLDADAGIAYVRLTGFSRDTAKELRKALEQLGKGRMKALILDLRFNPGGLLSAAVDVSDLFIASGRIVSTSGRASPERVWEARPKGVFERFPMAVLVNHYSASASEIVAACLQDHQRATVIGGRTWGKGSVQNVIELEGGRSALKLTTAAYRRPSGKNIHRFEGSKESDEWGVKPNEGFAIELGDTEMIGLIHDLRLRDTPPAAESKDTVKTSQAPSQAPVATKEKPLPAFIDRQLDAAEKHLRQLLIEEKSREERATSTNH